MLLLVWIASEWIMIVGGNVQVRRSVTKILVKMSQRLFLWIYDVLGSVSSGYTHLMDYLESTI